MRFGPVQLQAVHSPIRFRQLHGRGCRVGCILRTGSGDAGSYPVLVGPDGLDSMPRRAFAL